MLCDFGIAGTNLIRAEPAPAYGRLSDHQTFGLGTPGYMAPEAMLSVSEHQPPLAKAHRFLEG